MHPNIEKCQLLNTMSPMINSNIMQHVYNKKQCTERIYWNALLVVDI